MLETLSAPRTRSTRIRRTLADTLEARVQQSLRGSPYRHLQSVRCHCEDGTVLLLGILPTFFLKQMAQETIKRIVGVTEINNQVEVDYAQESVR